MKKLLSTIFIISLLSVANLSATDKPAITEYNPFQELQKMQQEMDKIFEEFHKKMMSEDVFSKFNSTFPTTPAIDLKDEGDVYRLKADIPGSDKNEIKITTKDGVLKIEAKKEKVEKEKKEDFIKKERIIGSYMRMITLPDDADSDKLKSDYKDGVLTITIPKKK